MDRLRRIINHEIDCWWNETRGDLQNRIYNRINNHMDYERLAEEDPPFRMMFRRGGLAIDNLPYLAFGTLFGWRDLGETIRTNVPQPSSQETLSINPEYETDIIGVMDNYHMRNAFFSQFELPRSLSWRMFQDGIIHIVDYEIPEGGEADICTICLDPMVADDKYFKIVCGHKFHCKCLATNLCYAGRYDCPVCRAVVEFIPRDREHATSQEIYPNSNHQQDHLPSNP